MIPLSMLLKRKDNTEAAVATDSADCACACDAAPKKQQTLEQHLKQYHHGQMPKGDCSWLKQYKKDHPDWQKDAAKVSKGEAAVDTAKKDAAPKGKKVRKTALDVIKGCSELSVTNPKKGEYTVRFTKGFKNPNKALGNSGWGIYNFVKSALGERIFGNLKTPSVYGDSVKFYGIDTAWGEDAHGEYEKGKFSSVNPDKDAFSVDGQGKMYCKGKDKWDFGNPVAMLKKFGVSDKEIEEATDKQALLDRVSGKQKYDRNASLKKKEAASLGQHLKLGDLTHVGIGYAPDGKYDHDFDVLGFTDKDGDVKFYSLAQIRSMATGGKKDSASEYLDAVEKDRKSKKSDKKDGGAKKDDAAKGGEEKDALQKYPTKAEVSKHFDFEKAEKVIWGEVSKFDHIKNMDSDILGDGKLSLAFDMVNGGMFNKDCEKVLGDALEKLGIPRSDMERPTKGGSGNRAIVSVKLDSLVDPSLAKNDGMSPEEIIDNNSEEDIEAMFSDDTRKQIVANARKVAKKDGYGQYILWSPDLGWSFSRKYGQEDSFKDFGQEIMGEVELINDGNITYPEFHVNTDFDRMKPVRRYDAIKQALEARKKELAK